MHGLDPRVVGKGLGVLDRFGAAMPDRVETDHVDAEATHDRTDFADLVRIG